MRSFIISLTLIASVASISATAQQASSRASSVAAYTTADTDIGTLLDNAATRAIVDKYIPGFSAQENIDMARPMTLKSIQQFAPEMITDKSLDQIDADLTKLAKK